MSNLELVKNGNFLKTPNYEVHIVKPDNSSFVIEPIKKYEIISGTLIKFSGPNFETFHNIAPGEQITICEIKG